MTASLYITLEPANGRPVTLARIESREVLLRAAQTAMSEADRRVRKMESEDEVLGQLQVERISAAEARPGPGHTRAAITARRRSHVMCVPPTGPGVASFPDPVCCGRKVAGKSSQRK